MTISKCAPFALSMMIVLSVILSNALSGCTSARAISKTSVDAPEKVVENFYNWYLGYEGNVIVDQAHQSSEYLTEAFVGKVDEIVASFDQGGYDPFLCAQDIPGAWTVDEALVSGDEASVVLHEVWNAGTEYKMINDVTVELQMVDGQWKISDIICK